VTSSVRRHQALMRHRVRGNAAAVAAGGGDTSSTVSIAAGSRRHNTLNANLSLSTMTQNCEQLAQRRLGGERRTVYSTQSATLPLLSPAARIQTWPSVLVAQLPGWLSAGCPADWRRKAHTETSGPSNPGVAALLSRMDALVTLWPCVPLCTGMTVRMCA